MNWPAFADDVIMFHSDPALGKARALALDQALYAAGVNRNADKDVDQSLDIIALGGQLSNHPPKSEPAADKAASVLARTFAVAKTRWASPQEVNQVLGVVQWFCLQQRSVYSCFDTIYSFVAREPQHVRTLVPLAAVNELLASAVLLPLMTACFDRQWFPEFTASDASGSYGFGVSVASCSASEAASVGRLADRRGEFVRVFPSPGDPPDKPRLGAATRLTCTDGDFKHVISSRAKWKAHSSVLEAHGLALAVKFRARNHRCHHHRLCMLVDAKAIIGAATKGRSSAHAIRAALRTIGACCLAADFLLRIVYIPSESNPSDAPSRGLRRHRQDLDGKRARTERSRIGTRTERRVGALQAAWQQLVESGAVSDCSDSDCQDTSSSS